MEKEGQVWIDADKMRNPPIKRKGRGIGGGGGGGGEEGERGGERGQKKKHHHIALTLHRPISKEQVADSSSSSVMFKKLKTTNSFPVVAEVTKPVCWDEIVAENNKLKVNMEKMQTEVDRLQLEVGHLRKENEELKERNIADVAAYSTGSHELNAAINLTENQEMVSTINSAAGNLELNPTTCDLKQSNKSKNNINDDHNDQDNAANNANSEDFNEWTYNLLKDFDKIPDRNSTTDNNNHNNNNRTSNFKYREPVVRKKAERAKLPGWDCDQCKGYYSLLESQMDEREVAKIRNRCSRHRSKAPVISNTPADFWCTQIHSTEELYREGYIRVGTPFTPLPPRRKTTQSEDEEKTNDDSEDIVM